MSRYLLCQVESQLCAFALHDVVETMRPLPINPVPGAPPFVQGASIIRGRPTPVVYLAEILGRVVEPARRFVVVRIDDKTVALAVTSVRGILEIPEDSFRPLPPLLRDMNAQVVEGVAVREHGLLVLLKSARLMPEDVFPDREFGSSAV